MGLAERRAVERFKSEDYPGWKERIDRAVGFEIEVEVFWEELAVADYTDRYSEFFAKVYFQPLVDALSASAADEMGKEAVRDGLSKIVVRNTDEYGSTGGIAFAEGILSIDHKPYSNIDYGDERAKTLQQKLEAGI